ncbi:MAG: AEC family transporter [Lachnospiraceae bacterium]|nr:AEC family transporter [Lachnospiraceae bacterium]
MNIFFTTLNQMAFLFLLIFLGFVLCKKKLLPENAAGILSKLENYIFIPALVLKTFCENFTAEKIGAAGTIFLTSFIMALIIIPVAVLAARLCSKSKYIQNIYTYGLAFSNFGFMGNAVVGALFPDVFFEYLIFTLPLWIMIYLWGVPVLLLSEAGQKQSLKERLRSFLNPMFLSMLAGMIIGLNSVTLPDWLTSAASSCAGCMSPIAMLLTGITVANADLKKIFTNVSIYAVSIIRLVLFPLVMMTVLYILKLDNTLTICAICSVAMPLGLNTIVIPSAYGKDTTVAAGMAIISHLLSCITIPVIFAVMMIAFSLEV